MQPHERKLIQLNMIKSYYFGDTIEKQHGSSLHPLGRGLGTTNQWKSVLQNINRDEIFKKSNNL